MPTTILKNTKCLLCDSEKPPLFSFPTDLVQLSTWLKIIDKGYLLQEYSSEYIQNYGRLCGSHFKGDAFTSPSKVELIQSALPFHSKFSFAPSASYQGAFSPAVPAVQSVFQTSSQTQQANCSSSGLGRSTEPVVTLGKQKEMLEQLKCSLTKDEMDFVVSKMKTSDEDPKSTLWSVKDKAMAMKLYLQHRTIYSTILRKYFLFPSASTLKKYVDNIVHHGGMCTVLMQAIGKFIKTMVEEERICVLVFGEMVVEKELESVEKEEDQLATKVLVFMIRGLVQIWKQAVNYHFLSDSYTEEWLADCLKTTINIICSYGLYVAAVVCQQGPVNEGMYERLGITMDKPYFMMNGRKVFAMYDSPHLLMSVRNNFKKCNLKFSIQKELGEEIVEASWKDIEEFYQIDCNLRFRCAPEITYEHISTEMCTKVEQAAQIFTDKLTTGLYSCAYSKLIKSTTVPGTTELVYVMHQLFDSMNAKKIGRSNKLANAASEHTNHIEFWEKSIKWIKSWEFVSSSGEIIKPACQVGWLLTLNSVIGLWNTLQSEINYLLTNRLNQDALENIFATIRNERHFRNNPNRTQFEKCFRRVMMDSFIRKTNSINRGRVADVNLIQLAKMDVKFIAEICKYYEIEGGDSNDENEDSSTESEDSNHESEVEISDSSSDSSAMASEYSTSDTEDDSWDTDFEDAENEDLNN